MYFSVRTEGRISYGHLGRTNLLQLQLVTEVHWVHVCKQLAQC